VYFATLNEGHTATEVRAITFSTLILGNVFLILSSLSITHSFISVLREKNWVVMLFPISALLMLALVLGIDFLSVIFKMQWPGWRHYLSVFVGALLLLLVLEILKVIRRRRFEL
jgi:Ca2+-transporting ATPase